MVLLSMFRRVVFSSALVLFLASICSGQIKSDFSVDSDGWAVFDLSTGSSLADAYITTGNPGGAISFTTSSPATGYYFFNAPAKFTGDLSKAYNQNLTFDQMVSFAGSDNGVADVQFQSPSGTILVYQLPVKPAVGLWSSYVIPMNETAPGWHLAYPLGAAPTKNDMKTVLANVSIFRIRVKYTNTNPGAYTSSIDNVVLNLQPSPGNPPIITTLSPLLGLVNSIVTIAGNNFNPAGAQNIVYFNGVKASVVTASATQLTVKVPPGAQFGRITVLNLANGLFAESTKDFSPQFDNNKDYGGRIIPSSFAAKVDFTVDATSPNQNTPSVGDIDGDGWNDLLTSELPVKQISIWRNQQLPGAISAASFGPKQSFSLLYGGKGRTVLKDFDGDGKLDVAVGCNDNVATSYIALFRNTSVPGTISFAPPSYIVTWYYTDGPIYGADIDGDGRAELLHTWDNSAGAGCCFFTIFQNLSTPGNIDFAAYQSYDFGVVNVSSEISTADLDGDGLLDITFPAGVNTSFYVFQNKSTPGKIALNAPFILNVGGSANNVAMADFDNDGKIDLAWSGYNTNALLISKNISTPGTLTTGSFATPVTITAPTGYIQEKVSVGDFNSDSKPDIILTGSSDLAVFENRAKPGVLDATSFHTGTPIAAYGTTDYLTGAVAADLNGDGKPEIISAETNGTPPHHIMIYGNQCFPVPIVTSLTPASGAAGNSVTISGDLFQTGNVAPALNVRSGQQNAAVTAASNTSATITIPTGARTDKLKLTVHGLSVFTSDFPVVFPTARVIDATSFATGTPFALTTATPQKGLVADDFDDDGKADIALIGSSNVAVVFQNTQTAAGQPVSGTSLTKLGATFPAITSIGSLDIDGDGKTDLISSGNLNKNTSASGAIAFAASPVGVQVYFNAVAYGDYNHDGKIDIAATTGSASVSVFENLSTTGAFTANGYLSSYNPTAPAFTRSGSGGSIASADLDGDGFEEIITADQSSGKFSWLQNLGVKSYLTTASFAAAVSIGTAASPISLSAKDFDGDGKVDIAIAYSGTTTFVSVFKNTSTLGLISFAARADFPCLQSAFDIVSQDLDGDGKPEMVVIHQPSGAGSFTIFQNTSSGTTVNFASAVNYAMPANVPYDVSVSDVNLDNKPDIVIVASAYPSGTSALIVFQNNIQSLTITINPQPANVVVCKDATATFTTGATGATGISYHWQKSAKLPIAFADLADGGGITGSGTATLMVNTTQYLNADQFIFRCRISATSTSDVFTNSVALTVDNSVNTPPVVTAASGCTGTAITLKASGATDGMYRWYTAATGGTAIANAVNGSFTTPVLSATTTFYVSVSNGTCESDRASAVATIAPCSGNPGENPPVIGAAATEIGINGIATIPLLNFISDPDNNLRAITLVSQPKSGAKASIDAQENLTVDYAGTDFLGLDYIDVQACDLTNLCVTREVLIDVGGGLIVYQGFSPNNDGYNQTWIIQFIDVFPDTQQNHVKIYNRWGDKVFDIDNYNNTDRVFKGNSNSGNELPTGTYFYMISFSSSTRKSLSGYLSLKR